VTPTCEEIDDAEDATAVSSGVSEADGGVGADGTNAAGAGQEFEPAENTIRNGVRQAERDEGLREDVPTTDEKEELSRLRRENRRFRIEREILAKAAAWFARETDSVPSKRSSS